MEYFKLNNDIMIPAIGIGTDTFGKADRDFNNIANQDFIEVKTALENGYRYFDCGVYYGNEDGIGKVISESGIDRKELFLSSKIPTKYFDNITYDDVFRYVEASLRKLRTDYLDLYLIHHYVDDKDQMYTVYKALLDLKRLGKIRSVGVSSFNKEQLISLSETFDEKPVINQLKLNPGVDFLETVNYCLELDILPVGYSVLKEVNDIRRIVLNTIGAKYNRTWHQVLLRFNYQMGAVSIPKSHNPNHQLNNISIFDFTLSDVEMNILKETLYLLR